MSQLSFHRKNTDSATKPWTFPEKAWAQLVLLMVAPVSTTRVDLGRNLTPLTSEQHFFVGFLDPRASAAGSRVSGSFILS